MRLAIACAVLTLLTPAAGAQTAAVNAARASGTAGERYDGYLGLSATAPINLRSQVATINVTRRALYTRLAAARGASPQDVGITAGCQLLARVGVGQSYMLIDGVWRRRGPGQGAPAPDYCR